MQHIPATYVYMFSLSLKWGRTSVLPSWIFCNEGKVRLGVMFDMKHCAANVLILTWRLLARGILSTPARPRGSLPKLTVLSPALAFGSVTFIYCIYLYLVKVSLHQLRRLSWAFTLNRQSPLSRNSLNRGSNPVSPGPGYYNKLPGVMT
jgi:hypothetical protein